MLVAVLLADASFFFPILPDPVFALNSTPSLSIVRDLHLRVLSFASAGPFRLSRGCAEPGVARIHLR